MSPIKHLEYVTDAKGKKTKVVVDIVSFNRIQQEIEDLEDALALEKGKKEGSGFKKWNDFIRDLKA